MLSAITSYFLYLKRVQNVMVQLYINKTTLCVKLYWVNSSMKNSEQKTFSLSFFVSKIAFYILTGLLVGRGKKKSNFAGFLGANSRKKRPISREFRGNFRGQFRWKTIGKKNDRFRESFPSKFRWKAIGFALIWGKCSMSIFFIQSVACCLRHLRNFVYNDSSFFSTSEAHFSALEFGFQVSSQCFCSTNSKWICLSRENEHELCSFCRFSRIRSPVYKRI